MWISEVLTPEVPNGTVRAVIQPLLTVDEVAAIFQVSPYTVRSWAREGVIPSVKVAGMKGVRFRRDDVEKLLASEKAG